MLTASEAAIKWSTATLPFGEALFVRMLFVLIPIAIIVWWRGAAVSLRIVSVRNLALRALFGTGSTSLVVASLSLLPIGQVLTLVSWAEAMPVCLPRSRRSMQNHCL